MFVIAWSSSFMWASFHGWSIVVRHQAYEVHALIRFFIAEAAHAGACAGDAFAACCFAQFFDVSGIVLRRDVPQHHARFGADGDGVFVMRVIGFRYQQQGGFYRASRSAVEAIKRSLVVAGAHGLAQPARVVWPFKTGVVAQIHEFYLRGFSVALRSFAGKVARPNHKDGYADEKDPAHGGAACDVADGVAGDAKEDEEKEAHKRVIRSVLLGML